MNKFPGTRLALAAYKRGMGDIKAGRSKRFKNVQDLIAELNGNSYHDVFRSGSKSVFVAANGTWRCAATAPW